MREVALQFMQSCHLSPIQVRSRGSAIGIATGYELDGRVRSLAKAKFFSPQHPDWLWGPPSLLSLPWGKAGQGVKPVTHLNLMPRWKWWSHNSSLSHVFMAWHLLDWVQGDNFYPDKLHVSYFGGPLFESLPEHQRTYWSFSWFSSFPASKCRFLPNPFCYISHLTINFYI
jgi:hypothetical protein